MDRTNWPVGPWDAEGDREEWRAFGLPCLAVRNHFGSWCGYAAVADKHPLYQLGINDESPLLEALLERLLNSPMRETELTFQRMIEGLFGGALRPSPGTVLDAHGGVTYAGPCNGPICHVPQPGESDEVWWFGFDTGHAGDFSPGLYALTHSLAARRKLRELFNDDSPEERLFPDGHTEINGQLMDTYRTLAYVKVEVERLAAQLSEFAVFTRRIDLE
jgi:hypothetical protein